MPTNPHVTEVRNHFAALRAERVAVASRELAGDGFLVSHSNVGSIVDDDHDTDDDPAAVEVICASVESVEPAEHIMQFFAYAHLPDHLQIVSRPFGELAQTIIDTLPRNPERSTALRKLLEGKDAAVRALVAKDVPA